MKKDKGSGESQLTHDSPDEPLYRRPSAESDDDDG